MGYFQIVLATFFWSLSAPYVKWIGLPNLYLASIRCMVPAVVMALWVATGAGWKRIVTGHRHGGIWSAATVTASLLNVGRSALYFWGFTRLPVGHAVLIIYTWPILIAIMNRVIYKETLTLVQWGCAVIALAGLGLIESQPIPIPMRQLVVGSLGVLVAAACNAGMILALQRSNHAITQPEQVLIQNGAGAILFFPFFVAHFGGVAISKTLISVGMAIVVGVVGFSLFFAAMRRIPTAQAAILSYIEVVFTLIIAALLLHEPHTWIQWLGGALIVVGSLGAQRFRSASR